jgi:hypothetical protein
MFGIDPRLLAILTQGGQVQSQDLGYAPVQDAEGKVSKLPPWVEKGMTYGDWKKVTPELSTTDQAWDKWYNTTQQANFMGGGAQTFNISPRARETIKGLFGKIGKVF